MPTMGGTGMMRTVPLTKIGTARSAKVLKKQERNKIKKEK